MNKTLDLKDDIKKHWTLYVLRQVAGKYYVGITTKTPEERMQDHLHSPTGARWTQKYKPLAIIERQDLGIIAKSDAEVIENKRTRELMRQYGYNNVRGGDLSEPGLYVRRLNWLIADKDLNTVYSLIFVMIVLIGLAVAYALKK